MAKRCDMCFQIKDNLQMVLPNMPAKVCKACNYKIGQVTSFLEYHQAQLSYQPTLTKETPPTPPDTSIDTPDSPSAPKRRAKRLKDTT